MSLGAKGVSFNRNQWFSTLAKYSNHLGEILKLLMPGCSPGQLQHSFCGWDPEVGFLPTPPGDSGMQLWWRATVSSSEAGPEAVSFATAELGGLVSADECLELLTASGHRGHPDQERC